MVGTSEIDVAAVGAGTGRYRAHLDGLRAVAVYLVVLFHAGSSRFAGGFVGVDVFFVLSGFLVTQLLMRELGPSGSLRLARFYSRRFRRLLPAALVTLVVTGVVYAAIASPADLVEAVGAFRAACLYYANWFFYRQSTDYWGDQVDASPVLHFWSLSVEEQFYLCWPLLLLALFLLTRRLRRQQVAMRVAVATAAVVSAVAALRLADDNLSRAYYGTDTRAYQLLAGAFLALTPALLNLDGRARRWAQRLAPFGLVAIVGIATSFVDVNAIQRGTLVVVATVVVLVGLENSDRGLATRVLSLGPIVYLGQVSYGTYLWHWPIVVFAVRYFHPTSLQLAGLTFLLATGLASLSYQVLERPVRQSRFLDRYRTPIVAAGLGMSALAGLVILPAVLDDNRADVELTPGDIAQAGDIDPSTLDWQAARDDLPERPDCMGAAVDVCTLVRGDAGKERILIVGDSHALMMIPTFSEIARRDGLTLSVAARGGCTWQRGLQYAQQRRVWSECAAHQDDWYDRVIPELDPDIVVVANRDFEGKDAGALVDEADGLTGAPGTEAFQRAVRTTSDATIRALRDDGRKVLIIEPTPETAAADDPLECISAAESVNECRFVANLEPRWTERYFRELADADDDVWSMDIDTLVCPYLPICDPVVDDEIVMRDHNHITATYARGLGDELAAYMHDNRILTG